MFSIFPSFFPFLLASFLSLFPSHTFPLFLRYFSISFSFTFLHYPSFSFSVFHLSSSVLTPPVLSSPLPLSLSGVGCTCLLPLGSSGVKWLLSLCSVHKQSHVQYFCNQSTDNLSIIFYSAYCIICWFWMHTANSYQCFMYIIYVCIFALCTHLIQY